MNIRSINLLGGISFVNQSVWVGILNLEVQNLCLLSKWLFRLLNEDDLWQEVLRNKYLKNKCLSQVVKQPGDSHFWAGMLKICFSKRENSKSIMGTKLDFGKDLWIGQEPLRLKYQTLYKIVRRKNVMVASVLSTTPLNISFRSAMLGDKLKYWINLVSLVLPTILNENEDVFAW